MSHRPGVARAATFCEKHNLRVPILMAPMASACPASLAIAVANAGGLGGCGALLMQPNSIHKWVADVRAGTNGGFQLNLWIPDPPPKRNSAAEDAVRRFLGNWGPEISAEAGDVKPPNFEAQCEAILGAGPTIISSIMGLFPEQFVARMKSKGIKWLATVTTVSEAKAAESAGADIIVAQGTEAGGHRGAFDAAQAESQNGRLVQPASHGRRRREAAGRCSGRNCRWPGCRRSAALGSIGGPNRDGVAQMP